MTRILLSGFEPFGGAASNPSWEAVQLVAARWGGGAELRVACLPTTFAGSVQRLGELIDAFSPDMVVATGMAQGRAAVTPEVVAINLIDARIPDNDGDRPRDVRVVEDAPDAYFSGL